MGSISLKDKISLLFSALAVLVSLSTLTWSEYVRRSDIRMNVSKNQYAAYNLGDELATVIILFTRMTLGDEESIRRGKNEVLMRTVQLQGLADQLDLRVSLKQLVENTTGDLGIVKSPERNIEDRIRSRHGRITAATFALGYQLSWIYNQFIIVKIAHPEEVSLVRDTFVERASLIQGYLDQLDIQETLPPPNSNFEDILQELGRINDVVRKRWEY
jgi:hypothetical protein